MKVSLVGASTRLILTDRVDGALMETASCLLVLLTVFEALSWRGRLILRLVFGLLGT